MSTCHASSAFYSRQLRVGKASCYKAAAKYRRRRYEKAATIEILQRTRASAHMTIWAMPPTTRLISSGERCVSKRSNMSIGDKRHGGIAIFTLQNLGPGPTKHSAVQPGAQRFAETAPQNVSGPRQNCSAACVGSALMPEASGHCTARRKKPTPQNPRG